MTLVEATLDGWGPCLPDRLIADKRYDSDSLDERLSVQCGVEPITPHRSNRSRQKDLLAAYVEGKEWTEAEQVAQKAEEPEPLSELTADGTLSQDAEKATEFREDRGFISNLGRAYLETGDLSKAGSRYMLYLRLAPNELEGCNGLGETAFRQGDYEKALRLFGQSLKLYGDQPKIAARISEIAKKSDDLAGKAQWVLENYAQRGGRPGAGRGPRSWHCSAGLRWSRAAAEGLGRR